MARLQDALSKVIDDPAVPSVGGFAIGLAYGAQGFRYLESTFIETSSDIELLAGQDLIRAMAHGVEDGGYSVCVVPPTSPGTPAVGLCFPRARLGMLYLPLTFDGARVVRDISPNDFSETIQREFGVRLAEPMLRYS